MNKRKKMFSQKDWCIQKPLTCWIIKYLILEIQGASRPSSIYFCLHFKTKTKKILRIADFQEFKFKFPAVVT